MPDGKRLEDIPVDAACDWDEDAIAVAIESAQALMEFDPDGARQLLAQAQAAERKRGKVSKIGTKEPYDPAKLYARMCRFYKGWTPRDIDQMHFPTFFAMVREAGIMNEEEQAEYNRAKQGNGAQTTGGLGDFPQARAYEGETVKLG